MGFKQIGHLNAYHRKWIQQIILKQPIVAKQLSRYLSAVSQKTKDMNTLDAFQAYSAALIQFQRNLQTTANHVAMHDLSNPLSMHNMLNNPNSLANQNMVETAAAIEAGIVTEASNNLAFNLQLQTNQMDAQNTEITSNSTNENNSNSNAIFEKTIQSCQNFLMDANAFVGGDEKILGKTLHGMEDAFKDDFTLKATVDLIKGDSKEAFEDALTDFKSKLNIKDDLKSLEDDFKKIFDDILHPEKALENIVTDAKSAMKLTPKNIIKESE